MKILETAKSNADKKSQRGRSMSNTGGVFGAPRNNYADTFTSGFFGTKIP